MSEDNDEKPSLQPLKNVTVLDLVPGWADVYEQGQKILILTLGHNGEVEHPLCLSVADAWKLARHCLGALSYHGNEKARALLPLMSKQPYDGDDAAAEDFVVNHLQSHCERTNQSMSEVINNPQPRCSTLDMTGLTIKAKFKDCTSPALTLNVLAAYQSPLGVKGPAMVLVRTFDFNPAGDEFIVKLGKKNTIQLRGHDTKEVLPKENWIRFAMWEPGQLFRPVEDAPVWAKMAKRQIKQRLGRRMYHVVDHGV